MTLILTSASCPTPLDLYSEFISLLSSDFLNILLHLIHLKPFRWTAVVHTFNPSNLEREAWRSLRSAWSTKQLPEQLEVHKETLSLKKTKQNKQPPPKKERKKPLEIKLDINEQTSIFLKIWKPVRIPFINIRKKKQKKYLGMGEKST